MGDEITYALVRELKKTSPPPGVQINVIKFIPYGKLNEVMPYLVRRAEENRGMLGGSVLQREVLYSELKRRALSWLGITSSID